MATTANTNSKKKFLKIRRNPSKGFFFRISALNNKVRAFANRSGFRTHSAFRISLHLEYDLLMAS